MNCHFLPKAVSCTVSWFETGALDQPINDTLKFKVTSPLEQTILSFTLSDRTSKLQNKNICPYRPTKHPQESHEKDFCSGRWNRMNVLLLNLAMDIYQVRFCASVNPLLRLCFPLSPTLGGTVPHDHQIQDACFVFFDDYFRSIGSNGNKSCEDRDSCITYCVHLVLDIRCLFLRPVCILPKK